MLVSNLNLMAKQGMTDVAEAIGAVDVIYMVDFKEPERWVGRHWVRSIQSRSGILYSSDVVEGYACKSKTQIAQKDLNLYHIVSSELHVWEYRTLKGLSKNQRALMNDNGYSHKVTYSRQITGYDEYVGRFFFLFKDLDNVSNCELSRQLYNTLPRNLSVLDAFQSQMISSRSIVSPFVGYGLIKPASIKILSMAAEGYSRNDIAKNCHLSSRGVDYHIEKMKILLNVKNNSNLIYVASKKLII